MASPSMLMNSANDLAASKPPQDMIAALSTSPQSFLQPTPALHAATLFAAKQILDPLANSVRRAQESRRDEARKKRKRGEHQRGDEESVLQLRQVYTEGFKVGQIWEQAKRVLDATGLEVEQGLKDTSDSENSNSSTSLAGLQSTLNGNGERVHFGEVDSGIGRRDGVSVTDEDSGGTHSFTPNDDAHEKETKNVGLEFEDVGEDLDSGTESYSSEDHPPETFTTDRYGLNDGFFSIDQFNKQSQFLEQRDALGESDGAASDEEDIDWSINPLASAPVKIPKNGDHAGDISTDISGDEDDEDGPTFDSAESSASSTEEADADGTLDIDDAMPGLNNTNDIKYTDFFDPPPKVTSRLNRQRRPLPKTQPEPPANDPATLEAGMRRAMSDVRRDLFEDDEEGSSSSGDDEEQEVPLATNLSTHEKQRAKIAREIARLEAANVSKRDWTLSGEARAADRPLNSLIEEELDFERVGKPVPIVTAEVSEDIEDLIKRRILGKEFDEVIRRRPDAVGATNEVRRGRVDLDDNRPQQSLADIYESEHLVKTDPSHRDPRSKKLKQDHAEIERLWKDVSAKLDILSNLNYKPKRPEASVNDITDAPTIMIEDIQPTAEVTGTDGSRLAPQEVYNPAQSAVMGKREEVMHKGGIAVAKEEMTREEKLRRRRREKERKKKGMATREKGGKTQDRQNILNELRRGGVKVIGKKGNIQDIEGRKVNDRILGATSKTLQNETQRGTAMKL